MDPSGSRAGHLPVVAPDVVLCRLPEMPHEKSVSVPAVFGGVGQQQPSFHVPQAAAMLPPAQLRRLWPAAHPGEPECRRRWDLPARTPSSTSHRSGSAWASCCLQPRSGSALPACQRDWRLRMQFPQSYCPERPARAAVSPDRMRSHRRCPAVAASRSDTARRRLWGLHPRPSDRHGSASGAVRRDSARHGAPAKPPAARVRLHSWPQPRPPAERRTVPRSPSSSRGEWGLRPSCLSQAKCVLKGAKAEHGDLLLRRSKGCPWAGVRAWRTCHSSARHSFHHSPR